MKILNQKTKLLEEEKGKLIEVLKTEKQTSEEKDAVFNRIFKENNDLRMTLNKKEDSIKILTEKTMLLEKEFAEIRKELANIQEVKMKIEDELSASKKRFFEQEKTFRRHIFIFYINFNNFFEIEKQRNMF